MTSPVDPPSTPTAAPTRKTLLYPSSDAIHRPAPPRPAPRATAAPGVERPSERVTLPMLLAAEAFDAFCGVSPPSVPEAAAIEEASIGAPTTPAPPSVVSSLVVEPTKRSRGPAIAMRVAAVTAFVCAVAASVRTGDSRGVAPMPPPRTPWPEHTTMGVTSLDPVPTPPSGGCVATDASQLVAARAQIKPGLDVRGVGTGFVVSFASTQSEAAAVRLEGSRLRPAEAVRVRSIGTVRHVTALTPNADGLDDLDVRIDTDDGRTLLADVDAPPLRLNSFGTSIVARPQPRAETEAAPAVHVLWTLPNPTAPVTLRASPRDDGGAALAAKRGSTLWLGLVDGALSPVGPLLAVGRSGVAVGTPSVAALGAGGVATWAERAHGDRSWSIVVATFGATDERANVLGAMRAIGEGMSPSIAPLPNGELLLAFAEGPPSEHRVVVQRLARDLVPMGEPLVASEPGLNAGQPVLAARSDGRALVVYFDAQRGHPASVHATALTCDASP